ncbi:MAG TPA: SpoVR family protein [Tepidisphaeraceae bacterium]|jgi:stage V sporulation protein R|nr:SpoVR family protein [Tepidisphaeraceae bacterium]
MPSHDIIPFPEELLKAKKEIRERARAYGLDFMPVIFEMCDYEQMNQIAAYGGFPQRYPHWRFGAEYESIRKRHHYGLGRIYEMVINNDPCYAYLQESNQLVDQKLVIAHVYGHADFFKNNYWFSKTNRKMMDEMANHATHVRKHIEKHGYDTVEHWMDICLSVEHLIDPHSMFMQRGPNDTRPEPPKRDEAELTKFKAKDYLDRWINPPAVMEAEAKKLRSDRAKVRNATPSRPTRDVLLYLLEHARLEDWQADCLSIVREESYYYAPQGMTKVMNEGWACVTSDALVFTDRGVFPMGEIVKQRLALQVSDGTENRAVYDWAEFKDRSTIRVKTRRGLELEGSVTHRLFLPDGTWRRLDAVSVGMKVATGGGKNLWASDAMRLSWQPARRVTLNDAAARAGVSIDTVLRFREGRNVRQKSAVALAVAEYDAGLATATLMHNKRRVVRIPEVVGESLALLLGYLVGDGHISEAKRVIGLTTGDEEQADRFVELATEVFGITPRKKWDDGRWRLLFSSETVKDFLKHLGMKTGICAREKIVPDCILRSPKPVVAAFIRAYFDCDGYAGKQGTILSTSSPVLGKTIQLLLLNFGILSSRRPHKDGCWHVHICGKSAILFANEIGFGLSRKQKALQTYIDEHHWYKEESWDDEIVAVESRVADVYDISVAETHRYAAQGFINHNSYWHSTLMTRHFVNATEIIDYADHHSGTVHMPPGNFNPYKIGIELFRDIEDRWNKGKFGKEYDEAKNLGEREKWDKGLGLGREKIFEVRKVYNDVNFIDEFMTPEFIEKHKFYQYGRDPHTGQLRILSRDPQRIKQTMLYQLTNMGQPFIYVVDGNYANRGELYLAHKHNGLDIEIKFAVETLKNLYRIWQRPVHLQARIDDDMILFSFSGDQPKQQTIHDELPKPAHQVL